MSTITTKQITQLQTICSAKFRNRDERLEMLSEMVGSPITSIKDLTELQADELIYFFNTGKNMDHSSYALFDHKNNQHRTILSHCHTLGWVNPNNPRFVDLNRLGGWLKSEKSPVKKPLKQMTKQELSKIIVALENITKSKFK
ncbi:hypothetical protein BAS06_09310 [Elizabethkingia miricola]|uniref:hypothetical protein n=1 Tax=Elizabethkingia miricola TaxID=172045 RepID=UPI00099A86E9|nr:hypothetical protein [Elizabethkingia miricola]MDV3880751.1 hypothetical protein [Elizabethkingia anophelis]OPB90506.1 hypothetical protein BAS06_09310 [Elizabethkingia miricola]